MKSFPYRERGLKLMEERFGNNLIQKFIRNKLKLKKEVRVLEIGFGEGRCLLDLRELFPDKNLILYGINDKRKGNLRKKSDFLKNAKRFNLSISKSGLPNIHFYDVGEGLKFESNYFDLIISQVSFHYVGDKAKLLEEIWRTLKFEGKAYLHIDLDYKEKSPDFMKFNKETPFFIIYNKGKIMKLSSYLKGFRNKGFDINSISEILFQIRFNNLLKQDFPKKSF